MASGEWITLASDGARRFEAYRAEPDAGRGAGLLILHDMFGPSAVFTDLADRFAAGGRAALVPNQFWRADPAGVMGYDAPHDAAWARAQAFDFEAAIAGLRLSMAALRRSPRCNGKVAALGFCLHGNLAFLAASRTDIDAAIAFYALGIAGHLGELKRITCPVELHYGLADAHVPRGEIDAVAAGVAGHGTVTVHLYPDSGHSFFNPVRPTYDEAAATLAARRIEAMLARLD